MDKQIKKLKDLVDKYLHRSREDILEEWGKPLKNSDNEVLFYKQHHWGIFKDEIAFALEENRVADIMMTQYICGKEYKSIFYYEGYSPEYKVIYL